MKKMELLLPCGNKEAFYAAVQSGADAVYLGGKTFGARAFANNFENEEIAEIVKYAHIRDVKVFVTVNTLVNEDEFDDVIDFVDFLYDSDVDGVIIQDLGLLDVVANRYENFSIVASTQLNVHTVEQAKFLKSLGVNRIVLARETALEDVKKIIEEVDVEIEVFGHGALCVCYSGECLMSSFIGKRSGNRGKCAQPCRLPYTLTQDGEAVGKTEYLLSTKDLLTLEHLDELVKIGVDSIKVEGRMKDFQYVALVATTYRSILDRYYKTGKIKVSEEDIIDLKKMFNRKFTKGYINNEEASDLVHTYRPNHQGIELGEVIDVSYSRIKLKLVNDLAQGDGLRVLIDNGQDDGMMANRVYKDGNLVSQAYAGDIIELDFKCKAEIGDKFIKTTDKLLNESFEHCYDKEYKKVAITGTFKGYVGGNMCLELKDSRGNVVEVKNDHVLEKASKVPTSDERIKEQLSKLGNTPYEFSELSLDIDDGMMVPMGLLNELRRSAVEKLSDLRAKKYERNKKNKYIKKVKSFEQDKCLLNVSVQNMEQLDAVMEFEIDDVYYKDVRTYKMACEKYPNKNIILKCPRVNNHLGDDINNISVDELGYIDSDKSVKTSSYLNVTNSYACALLHQNDVERICLSQELTSYDIRQLMKEYHSRYGSYPNTEVVVYGYPEVMVSKYCPITYVVGGGKKHCGKCKQHKYALKDRLNYNFRIMGNPDCTTTLLNSKRVALISYIDEIKDLNVKNIRLDFTVEDGAETRYIVDAHYKAFNNMYYNFDLVNLTFGYYTK